jgi:tetratricopeptide (TPR) repeat protein
MTEKRPTLRDRIRAGRMVRYLANGRYDQALADYDRAIELDAAHTWAITSRAAIYRKMGRYEEALADFDRAIGLDADHAGAWAWASRGETYQAVSRSRPVDREDNEDNSARAAGHLDRCGRPIAPGRTARMRACGPWVYEACPTR